MRLSVVRWIPAALLLSLGTRESFAAALVDDFSVDGVELNTAAPPPFPVDTTQVINGLGQTVTRRYSVGASVGDAQVQVLEGNFGFISEPATAGLASLSYDTFTADLSATPFLKLDFLSILGEGVMAIEMRDASGIQTVGLIGQPLVNGGMTSLVLDVRSFADYQAGFLSDVGTIILAFEGTQGPFFAIKLDRVSFTDEAGPGAVIPESSSAPFAAGGLLILLGLAREARRRA